MAKTVSIGRCLRPTLARLRRSTAYGVLGLATIAIAGCAPDRQKEPFRLTCKTAGRVVFDADVWRIKAVEAGVWAEGTDGLESVISAEVCSEGPAKGPEGN